MANLSITYYERMARDQQGNILPIPEEPNKGGQVVSFTTSTQSNPVPKSANFVRLQSDADAYLVFGDSPVATTASALKLKSGVTEYFGINSDARRAGTLRIAAYDGSS